MRGMFPGHYRRTDEELDRIWEDGLFVLDANVLLNLYRYSERTRKEFLGVLRGVQDKLWIPHQVAEEFLADRLLVIRLQKKAYNAIRETLNDARKDVEKKMGEMHKDPGIVEAKDLRKKAEEHFRDLIGDAEKLEKEGHIQSIKETYSREDDEIWTAFDEIFEGKVGNGLSEKGMTEVLEAGPRRYESRTPPGFKDDNDKSKLGYRKFGDLVLWFETIEEAKDSGKLVLFVTDDRKEDWWDNDVKPPVPRPELGNEMRERAGMTFHMFMPLDFSEWAGEKLNQKISPEAAEEIEELGPREDEDSDVDYRMRLLKDVPFLVSNPDRLPRDAAALRGLTSDLEVLREATRTVRAQNLGSREYFDNTEAGLTVLLDLIRAREDA